MQILISLTGAGRIEAHDAECVNVLHLSMEEALEIDDLEGLDDVMLMECVFA